MVFLASNLTFVVNAQVIQSGLVAFDSYDETGVVQLKLTMFGAKNKAIRNAPERAFHALLFEGIAGANKSQLQKPLIVDKDAAQSKHADYFNNLFDQGGYLQYVQSMSNPKKVKYKGFEKRKAFLFIVRINYLALKNDLRKKGLLKKMGFR